MKYLTIIGCISTFALCYVPYGPLFMCGNVICMCLSALFLRKYKKAQPLRSSFFEDKLMKKDLGIFLIVGMMGAGILHSIYFIWKFYQFPLTEAVPTKEDLDAKIKSEKRERKLKHIGL